MYTVSGGKSVPAWLSDKKKRSLKKDEAYRRRIELVQARLLGARGLAMPNLVQAVLSSSFQDLLAALCVGRKLIDCVKAKQHLVSLLTLILVLDRTCHAIRQN